MSGADYPKALYADGGDELIWGQPVRTAIAQDEDEEKALRSKGWRLHPIKHPLDHDGDGRPGGSTPRRGRPPKTAAPGGDNAVGTTGADSTAATVDRPY